MALMQYFPPFVSTTQNVSKRSSKYSLLNKPYIITVFSSHRADVVYPTEYTYPTKSILSLKLSGTKPFVI